MADSPRLSKSRYIAGLQCAKRLWYEVNAFREIPAYDAAAEERFAQGHEVGRLATRLFPGGVEVARDKRRWSTTAAATERALTARIPLYEAAFVHAGGACRVDILVPVEGGQWDLLEVKSSTSVKEVHLADLAFQTWVVRGAGVPVRRACLVRLDSSYVRQGEIDPTGLFAIDDLTTEVEAYLDLVPSELARQQEIAALPAAPEAAIGPRCKNPHGCPLIPVCWKGVPESSVLDLVRGGTKAWELYHQGVRHVAAIPPHVELSERQRIQVEAARTGEPKVDRAAIAAFLAGLVHPVHCLDFETFQVPLPPFDGARPWQQIPFQWSLHVVDAPGARPRTAAFLADGDGDPRLEFLESLRVALAPQGAIVAFNVGFERQRLEEAAEVLPEHGEWVASLAPRFVDLLEPFARFDYYHPAQNGSASLKAVLPVLGARGYDHLEVQEGTAAAREFLRLRSGAVEPAERERVRQALLDYCGRDTEGMVEIVAALEQLVTGQTVGHDPRAVGPRAGRATTGRRSRRRTGSRD